MTAVESGLATIRGPPKLCIGNVGEPVAVKVYRLRKKLRRGTGRAARLTPGRLRTPLRQRGSA